MSEEEAPRRMGRRAMLTGAAGAAAAVVGNAVLNAVPVAAADNQGLVLGVINEAATVTRIYTPSFSNYNRAVLFTGPDYGLRAFSTQDSGTGIEGSASGINGVAISATTDGHSSTTALKARSEPEGIAVDAISKNGAAVRATATGGYALDIHGRAVFDRSGKVTIAAGKASKAVSRSGTMGYIGPDTIILATIQGYAAGTWVAGVIRNGDQKFTIRLNRPAPTALVVGWFLVN